ncbi:bifunctional phosphopantothenoylcysteine decarboxylase/phosphopantothenate--cysteine ligase CoaBC [Desulfobulbus alkaliphilus]|uniref:bifunctional phosphopantothenoylcysteine decarboxylase/phosphopantothenate--cysteine ligase CoaBC n=1 Tax=Desulfobulbus alkaliphilus TaxID=869814 RepID=UPI00196265C4|nr:bifunctional phosphopantothenoylcysteine decarboxylase/phosphopantothenate--cysteine ligase CoaBC [Desulfobulbus alkaliphilus]MBM9535736.1 bifunctional phosphopantothenoylcysteine decarboxylase/phosphopantothenate--cysteine ligase CoaBC [Desulfobulbus alkaliphilus]
MAGLQGKKILFGVSGSIAAYKAAEWVRELVREEAVVTVIMTAAAERFVSSLTFAALSGNPVHLDMFDTDSERIMAHINLSREADAMLIAPATAQTLARLASGIAEDLLATVALAARIPIVVCPAMNSAMLAHPAVQENISRVCRFGYHVVHSTSGSLACGEIGDGRLTDWESTRETLLALFQPDDLCGRQVVITAGPTREPLDPVRFLSNRSSGKMGFALARTARRRGAQVTLITGPVSLANPPGVDVIRVSTAEEMAQAVFGCAPRADVIVKSAAVADFKPIAFSEHKLKKKTQGLQLDLEKNIDILAELGRKRPPRQLLVGFAAESREHASEGRRKLVEKNLDLIVVNDILGPQTGFEVETNQVILIDRKGHVELPLLSKEATAHRIWDAVVTLLPAVSVSPQEYSSGNRDPGCA